MRLLTLPCLLLLCALFLLSACGKVETRVEQGYREGIFWAANGGEPRNLDPHTVTGLPEFNIIQAIFEGLVDLHPETSHPIPSGALSWEVLDDSRRFRFHLNPEGRWSNGDPVTAEDYLFSYQRLLTPALGAQYASELYVLKGARDYHLGKTTDFSTVGVRAIEPYILELELENKTPEDYFLRSIAYTIWRPIHPKTILRFGRMEQRDTKWTRPGNLVSNGPFILKEWNVNSHITVVQNPYYRNRESLGLKEIRFIPISNLQTEERLFRTGMLHNTNGVLPSRLDYYRKHNPQVLRSDPWFGTYYLIFNTRVPPLDDPKVRRALSMAINRENIVRQITRGGHQPAYAFVPPGLPGWPERQWFKYDPEQARQLLASANVNPLQFASIRYLFNTQEVNTAIAEAITHMWKDELGIDIGMVNQEWKVYLDTRRNRNYQILRASWIGDYPDPLTFLGLWTSDSTNNTSGWANAEYDRLLQQASQTTDPMERYRLLSEAEGILLEEMPLVPLYFLNRIYLLDPQVEGWTPNLLDRRPWSTISFRKPD